PKAFQAGPSKLHDMATLFISPGRIVRHSSAPFPGSSPLYTCVPAKRAADSITTGDAVLLEISNSGIIPSLPVKPVIPQVTKLIPSSTLAHSVDLSRSLHPSGRYEKPESQPDNASINNANKNR